VGLVGPNGAGKTTLLNLATGMLAPTTGTIEVLGGRPAAGPAQLARVGYLAQDAPVYAGLSVADHLRLGAHLNPGWDAEMARRRIDQLDLVPGQKAGKLSGGQRAQLALTLALGKRPELLILDEPVASLDPLARREFLQDLMETITCCPARAATRPRCRTGWRSSPPATPTCRPRCWSAPAARSSTRPGRSPRWAWKTWCSPT